MASCWMCGRAFATRKDLKSHVGTLHGRLSVVCVFCNQKQMSFKRVSDLKVHIRHQHPTSLIHLPAEIFSEHNGFWWSLYPRDYAKIVQPSPRRSVLATRIRSLVLDWVQRMGPDSSKTQDMFMQGWKVADDVENLPLLASAVQEEQLSYIIRHINLTPGVLFVDMEAPDSGASYRVNLSNSLFSDTQAMRAVTRKLAAIVGVSNPISKLDQVKEDASPDKFVSLANTIGIDKSLIASVRVFRPFDSNLKRPSVTTDLHTCSQSKRSKTDSEHPSDSALPGDADSHNQGIEPPQVSSCAVPMVTLAPVSSATSLATAHTKPVQSIVHPSPAHSVCAAVAPKVTPKVTATPAEATTAQDVLNLCIRKMPMNNAETPQAASVPPSPCSTVTQEFRAAKLLRMGCMPQWQPARREWNEEEVVSFAEGELVIFWPPKNFKELTPDQKLLQWEFAAMSLLKARGDDITAVDRCSLLDMFNFLALPGTAGHRMPKAKQSPLVKARYFTYEALRRIATGHDKNEKYLAILECGAMMRDTSLDKHLKACSNIPLRLSK